MLYQYSFYETYTASIQFLRNLRSANTVSVKTAMHQYSFYETYTVPAQFLWNVRSTNIVSMAAFILGTKCL